MEYVLIAFLYTGSSGIAVSNDFHTEDACHYAGRSLKDVRGWNWHYVCVPKGEKK